MESKLIVMLTHNDHTVENAEEVFDSSKDLPAYHWGFKDVGLSINEMKKLNSKMKEAGKTTFLEVVTYTEEECLRGAKLTHECGFDYLTGTLFFPSVSEYAKSKKLKYYPFIGDVGGSPVTMNGEMDQIVETGRKLCQSDVDGVDLVAYRYQDGDPEQLSIKAVKELGREKVIIAGSIASEERIRIMNEISPFAFTMGSALFDGKFVPGASFRDNLKYVIDFMESLNS